MSEVPLYEMSIRNILNLQHLGVRDGVSIQSIDRLRVVSTLWEGAARAEDAQGTPSQSHISPSILVYEDYSSLKQQILIPTRSAGMRASTRWASGTPSTCNAQAFVVV